MRTFAALLLATCDEVPVPHCADMRPADLAATAPDLATVQDMGGMSDMGCADGGQDAGRTGTGQPSTRSSKQDPGR